jgi:acetyltransferase
MTDPTQTAERLKAYSQTEDKPIIASWMGGAEVSAGTDILNRRGIPMFYYPDTAATVFNQMWKYTDGLSAIDPDRASDGQTASAVIDALRSEGRTLLAEIEAKRVLSAYGIPVTETEWAGTEAEAEAVASKIGFPVVIKLHSTTITHKTDVGGVHLGIEDGEQARAAFRSIRESVSAKAPGDQAVSETIYLELANA